MRVWQILPFWFSFTIRLRWVWVCVATYVWCLNCLLSFPCLAWFHEDPALISALVSKHPLGPSFPLPCSAPAHLLLAGGMALYGPLGGQAFSCWVILTRSCQRRQVYNSSLSPVWVSRERSGVHHLISRERPSRWAVTHSSKSPVWIFRQGFRNLIPQFQFPSLPWVKILRDLSLPLSFWDPCHGPCCCVADPPLSLHHQTRARPWYTPGTCPVTSSYSRGTLYSLETHPELKFSKRVLLGFFLEKRTLRLLSLHFINKFRWLAW